MDNIYQKVFYCNKVIYVLKNLWRNAHMQKIKQVVCQAIERSAANQAGLGIVALYGFTLIFNVILFVCGIFGQPIIKEFKVITGTCTVATVLFLVIGYITNQDT